MLESLSRVFGGILMLKSGVSIKAPSLALTWNKYFCSSGFVGLELHEIFKPIKVLSILVITLFLFIEKNHL